MTEISCFNHHNLSDPVTFIFYKYENIHNSGRINKYFTPLGFSNRLFKMSTGLNHFAPFLEHSYVGGKRTSPFLQAGTHALDVGCLSKPGIQSQKKSGGYLSSFSLHLG